MPVENAAMITAPLLAWVALVYLLMASGVRRGELVWSGRQPRLLAPELRIRSVGYAIGLILSGYVLAVATGLISSDLIPDRYIQSATFAVTVFLGLAGLFSLLWGSRWERMLFAPITLMGALVAGWLTFG